MNSEFIFDKGNSMEREWSSQQMVGSNWTSCAKKTHHHLNPYLASYVKINSKWTRYLNVNPRRKYKRKYFLP